MTRVRPVAWGALALALALGTGAAAARAPWGRVVSPGLETGEYWASLTPKEKQIYLTGFLAGAATEQVRGRAVAAHREGDSLAVSSREIAALRSARSLQFRFGPSVYSAQIDDYYWAQDQVSTPIVDVLVTLNRRMLEQQNGSSR